MAAILLCAGAGAVSSAASSSPGVTVARGFTVTVIANVPHARELAVTPGGDLIVGTLGTSVYIVPHAQGNAATPRVFWEHPSSDRGGDAPNAGVTLYGRALYVGSNTGVWRLEYRPGATVAGRAARIASVRTGPIAPHSDGDVHSTTSVAVARGRLYVSVGSSCNACVEVDPTRAAVLSFPLGGGRYAVRARRIRNAIALAVDPSSGDLWLAGAGQDGLPFGHPYEFADDLSAHAGVADYGWPECEENHVAYTRGAQCARTVVPLVELPAYSTVIGATFYAANARGRYVFPARYRGGLFLAAHGSWHRSASGAYAAVPQVVFVAMRGDRPARPVNWNDPGTQWTPFLSGFQYGGVGRRGRPTGIAVGTDGSLFVADDLTGDIYRIRPSH